MTNMFCGCSKGKKPKKGRPNLSAVSDFSLLADIPECSGVEISESWCPILGNDYPSYPRDNPAYPGDDPAYTRDHPGYMYRGGHTAPELRDRLDPPICDRYHGHHPADHMASTRGLTSTQHVNRGFDSGIDTGSSPDSAHTSSLSRSGQTVTIVNQFGSTPLLEVCERGSLSSLNGRPCKMLQSYRGQVKLSVYFNSGLLTLHVRQAKHLMSKWSTLPCPYVKVAVIPDELHTSRCKTKPQTDTDHPRFDEKFSFELGDEDFSKRLLVSVHSKDPNHNRSELLGCMSFGINNIIRGKTNIHGWYYLLSEQVGCRKHLQAHNKRHHVVPLDNYSCIMSETASCSEFSEGPHQDISPLSSVLRMNRGKNGYGFTLSGGCPCAVLTVETGSPADEVGMRVGDMVLSINYQDVSRSTADTVARIVRFHPEIEIEVQSPPAPAPSCWHDFNSPLPSTDDRTNGGHRERIIPNQSQPRKQPIIHSPEHLRSSPEFNNQSRSRTHMVPIDQLEPLLQSGTRPSQPNLQHELFNSPPQSDIYQTISCQSTHKPQRNHAHYYS